MGIRRDIDLIKNAFYDPTWSGQNDLHKQTPHDTENNSISLQERAMAQQQQQSHPSRNWDEWFMEAASKRYIAEGKTPEEARKIIIDAFASQEIKFPSIDEL